MSPNKPVATVSFPPARSKWAVIGVVAGAMFGGAGAGSALAWALAPGSMFAPFVGFLALPLVLGLGYQIWQVRITALVARRFARGVMKALWQALIRRRRLQLETLMPTREDAALLLERMVQATSAFTHIGVFVGIGAGILVGIATDGRLPVSVATFALVCTVYGRALTRLARSGYLPPPDGE